MKQERLWFKSSLNFHFCFLTKDDLPLKMGARGKQGQPQDM